MRRALVWAALALIPVLAGAGGGVVVADDPLAAEAGAEVLARGGNAMDAAVATAFALAVTYPQAGNLGGGGFLLHRSGEGDVTLIDFRERAPAASTADMFLRADGSPDLERSRRGPLSVAVPGSVAGLLRALERFGTWPRERVLAPAIRLAAEGFAIPPGLAQALAVHRERLSATAYTEALFYPGGELPSAGDRLVQEDLGRTLGRIARHGEDGFYRGGAARALVSMLKRLGGRMSRRDLAGYSPREREPLRGSYRGHEVITVGPPSAGGVALLEMLHILEGYDLRETGAATVPTVHRMASAMKLAFFDRNRYVGDPDHVDVPTARLTSREHAATLRARIPAARSLPSSVLGAAAAAAASESTETTHLSVLDGRGGAVVLTTTINSTFGSGMAAEGLGYLLNNEMDDFTTAPGHPNQFGLVEGEANRVAPGKRMASSMCPTLVVQDGVVRLALGSPGGPQIPNAVLQVILNVLDFGMDLDAAVQAPRVHHQWLPDVLRMEPGLPAGLAPDLQAMGYAVEEIERIGNVLAAGIDPVGGDAVGAADRRRYAVAARAATP